MAAEPRVLYKYLHAARLGDVLPRDGTPHLRVTQPGALNDPFESVPAIELAVQPGDHAGLAAELTRIAPEHPVDAATVAQLAAGVGVRAQQAAFLEQINERWGVVSFSTTATNALMWSHYAGEAAGFVVGFDVDILRTLVPADDGTLDPVVYATTRPLLSSISEVTSGGPRLTEALLTKSADWTYEDEWRLILPLSSTSRTGKKVRGRDGEFELCLLSIPPAAVVEVLCTEVGNTNNEQHVRPSSRRSGWTPVRDQGTLTATAVAAVLRLRAATVDHATARPAYSSTTMMVGSNTAATVWVTNNSAGSVKTTTFVPRLSQKSRIWRF